MTPLQKEIEEKKRELEKLIEQAKELMWPAQCCPLGFLEGEWQEIDWEPLYV